MTDATSSDAQTQAELLAAGYDAFNRRDAVYLRELMVDDFQWFEAEQVPGRKNCHSAQEFAEYMDGFDRLWAEFIFEPLEMEPAESGAIIVKVRGKGKGKASGEEFELVIHHVWRLRDGQVARMEAFLDRREAIAAAEGSQ